MVSKKKSSLFFKNYFNMIENSVGTNLFRNFYLKINGGEKDILENGRLSCAVFVSSILVLRGLIEGPPRGPHATVKSLIKNMENSGWRKIKKLRPGAVLVWEPRKIGRRVNEHVGFYFSAFFAVSNRAEEKGPFLHHWTFGEKRGKPVRRVSGIYWHDKLGE